MRIILFDAHGPGEKTFDRASLWLGDRALTGEEAAWHARQLGQLGLVT